MKFGKPLHLGDVFNLVDAFDATGHYKKGRQGKPPLTEGLLFKAIKDFQTDEGLDADAWMTPGGPTLQRLNEILPQKLERPWRGAKAKAPLYEPASELSAPAAEPRALPDDLGDWTFADLARHRRSQGLPPGIGPAYRFSEDLARTPQPARASDRYEASDLPGPLRPGAGAFGEGFMLAQNPARRGDGPESRQEVPRTAAGGKRPKPDRTWPATGLRPSPQPGSKEPAPVGQGAEPHADAVFVALPRTLDHRHTGQKRFWDALGRSRVSPCLRNILQVCFELEGGDLPVPGSRTRRGITMETLRRMRDVLGPTGARIQEPAQLNDDQRIRTLNAQLDRDLARAGGLAAIDSIARTPGPDAAEVALIVTDTMLHYGGTTGWRAIQDSIVATIAAPSERDRRALGIPLEDGRPWTEPPTAWGTRTQAAIEALIRNGHGPRLRQAILTAVARRTSGPDEDDGDIHRREWLRKAGPMPPC